MRQVRRAVVVRRGANGLGIDVNERNTIVRILPGSLADEDGSLQVGDLVVAVDGVELGRKCLKQVMIADC